MGFEIRSSAFEPRATIPNEYTCDGADRSPPLCWYGQPEGTRSLALIVDDPDAPDPAAPKMTWVHWVVFNLPPTASGLPEAVRALPPGAVSGQNDWGRTGYGGPCPPIGEHRYFFKLYALDERLPLSGSATKADVVAAMQGHVLAETALFGTYRR